MSKLKQSIKSIPFVGSFAKWIYAILNINSTKENLQMLKRRFDKLEQKHNKLNSENQQLKIKFTAQEEYSYDLVRKHITSQLIYFHEKIDTFLEKTDHEKIINLKKTINQDFLDEYYLHFENKFRGTRDHVLNNCKEYLNLIPSVVAFDSKEEKLKSLDIGCGRAEWVELMDNEGYEAYGIDLNPHIVEIGKLHNLENLEVIDAFDYFKKTEDNTFDLVSAFHIIEHITFEKLVEFLKEIKRISKPNATILLETPNPKNTQVAGYYFYIDLTHLNPLPHQSIEFLLEYLGFVNITTNFIHPMPNITPIQEAAQDYLIVAKNDNSFEKIIPSLLKKNSLKKTIFIDKSALRIHDGNSGIQRVVKKEIKSFKELFSDEYNIEPVYLKKISPVDVDYYYDTINAPVSLKKEDILYIPDLSYNSINRAVEFGLYDRYKQSGVKIVFLVHDILPITHEQFFKHQDAKKIHHKYITNIARHADLIVSTSEVGKKEITKYLKSHNINIPKINSLNLGADITTDFLSSTKNIIEKDIQNLFLMVGTLEPRKAHAQVIEAFTILWEQYTRQKTIYSALPILMIIGKKGWLIDETIKMIYKHPLFNKNLFYIENADDLELLAYYQKADAIIVASYAEGFGLPLVEAMHQKKQIIARDIPVFKEIAEDYPFYFKDTKEPNDIVDTLKVFFNTPKKIPKQKLHLSWEEHTRRLVKIFKGL